LTRTNEKREVADLPFFISRDSGYGLATFPERRHRVQTRIRFTLPSTTARTRWMLGLKTRLVCRSEWLTLDPDPLSLPQMSHRKLMTPSLFLRMSGGSLTRPRAACQEVVPDAAVGVAGVPALRYNHHAK
jgi:hypothetical protein